MGDHGARGDGVGGNPEHARQVVAAAPGEHAEDGAGNVPQRVGDGPGEPVAAERRGGLPAAGGLAGERAGVVEVAGVGAAHLQPVPAQGARDIRGDAAGATAAGGGIDDQADGGGHGASVLRRGPVALGVPPGAPARCGRMRTMALTEGVSELGRPDERARGRDIYAAAVCSPSEHTSSSAACRRPAAARLP